MEISADKELLKGDRVKIINSKSISASYRKYLNLKGIILGPSNQGSGYQIKLDNYQKSINFNKILVARLSSTDLIEEMNENLNKLKNNLKNDK